MGNPSAHLNFRLGRRRWTACRADGQFRGRPHDTWSRTRPAPDFSRINQAIETGDFAQNPEINTTLNAVRGTEGALHILGLLSPGACTAMSSKFLLSFDTPQNAA